MNQNEEEVAEMYLLYRVYSLLREIEALPKHKYVHWRLWTDGSGGLFQMGKEGGFYQMEGWNNLQEALAVLKQRLLTWESQ